MNTPLPSHILGFPRIGAHRELKYALEAHWKGDLDEKGLEVVAAGLRAENRQRQLDAGLSWITVGDFALYDHVLSAFDRYNGNSSLGQYFERARGSATSKPWDMTKWFDTNYHYLVPELNSSTPWQGDGVELLSQVKEALLAGVRPERIKPVILGPVSFLALSRWSGEGTVWHALGAVQDAFDRILRHLAALGIVWVQVDEPVLALDEDDERSRAFRAVYGAPRTNSPRLLLTSVFGEISHQRALVDSLVVDGVHLDLVRGAGQLADWPWPEGRVLSLGLIDGRTPWALRHEQLAARTQGVPPNAELWIGTSCSLQHLPVDLGLEKHLDPSLLARLAFAEQKLHEVARLAREFPGEAFTPPPIVGKDGAEPPVVRRFPEFSIRQGLQAERLNLPPFPTTTIGSFPQTEDVRALRARFRKGQISQAVYDAGIRELTRDCIAEQEALGLDVLVHGELERTDMVEFFGQQLAGFAFSESGWVQSYGSRCVKPPILHADVSRPHAMTVDLARFAQSQTTRPMKGMLTGPITIVQWSFVRDDLPRATVVRQVAEALALEVLELEAAGLPIIQVDEAALREGLPLRQKDHNAYWATAVEAFHCTVGGVQPQTQIHTHMCYSDFTGCLDIIAQLDADVLTVESSRSAGSLVEEFLKANYPNALGPGIWDIHSPRIPSTDEMEALIEQASRCIDPSRLWVNPDCGLKTRGSTEVRESLAHLVEAARRMRVRAARSGV